MPYQSARPDELTGVLLDDRYRVGAVLARGGMSTVYRAVDRRLDRPVAVKVMDPRFAGDPAFQDRFQREARSAARLRHPGVVAVHDQGVDRDGTVFLVMELLDGGTLRDLLRQCGRLSLPAALSVLEPALSALAAAHHEGLVHRDVKPENILISSTGLVKVADFGLVRAAAESSTTADGVILGTAAYLSPEQVATGAADARSDVYAAGIVLYEMLTGAPPYTGDTALSVAYRHVNNDVPAPSGRAPGLSTALDDQVLRATRRDPAARPVDAGAFLLALRRVRGELRMPPVPVPVPRASAPPALPIPRQQRAAVPVGAPRPPAAPGGASATRAMPRATQPAPTASDHARQRAHSRRIFACAVLVVLLLAALLAGGAWSLGSP